MVKALNFLETGIWPNVVVFVFVAIATLLVIAGEYFIHNFVEILDYGVYTAYRLFIDMFLVIILTVAALCAVEAFDRRRLNRSR